MAIPAGVARVALEGHLATGESFVTGIWVAVVTTLYDDLASAIAASLEAHWGAWLHLIPPDAGYDNLVLYAYPTGGPDADSVHFVSLTAGAGTNSSGGGGWDGLAQVLTLQTDFAGRSHRGRMYLPATAEPMVDGLFANTDWQGAVDTAKTWFDGINGIAGEDATVAVVSDRLSLWTPVRSVKSSNKPGSQRRREKSVKATQHQTDLLV